MAPEGRGRKTGKPGKGARESSGGRIRPFSFPVVADLAEDRLVFGCDDTAKSEFLNKRPAKGGIGAPGQSQSNLWFTPLDTPDHLGPALGRGSVWVDEPVKADVPSDPFLLRRISR
ncbi:hypothetical protein EBR56_12100 [bacterium]|nr:hypothetical protein [bacterium]